MIIGDVFCAVVITHSNAATFSFDRVRVPFIATNDNCPVPSPQPLICLDTATSFSIGPLSSERAQDYKISAHYYKAIKLAFSTFQSCQILSIIEDDLLLSYDYWHVVKSYQSDLLQPFSVFSAINTIGAPELGPWYNDRVRVTSSTLGLAFTLNRKTWYTIAVENKWPARHWDTFLRNTYNWKSIVPEVSRAKHTIMPGATHGQSKDTQIISSMPMYQGEALLSMAPLTIQEQPTQPIRKCDRDSLISDQGDYNGIFYGNNPSLLPCEAPWFEFKQAIDLREAFEAARVIQWSVAERGQSCDEFCTDGCVRAAFDVTPNSMFIDLMSYHSGCEHLAFDMGLEIPSIDHGQCIISDHNSHVSCASSHRDTQRLCPCAAHKITTGNSVFSYGIIWKVCALCALLVMRRHARLRGRCL